MEDEKIQREKRMEDEKIQQENIFNSLDRITLQLEQLIEITSHHCVDRHYEEESVEEVIVEKDKVEPKIEETQEEQLEQIYDEDSISYTIESQPLKEEDKSQVLLSCEKLPDSLIFQEKENTHEFTHFIHMLKSVMIDVPILEARFDMSSYDFVLLPMDKDKEISMNLEHSLAITPTNIYIQQRHLKLRVQ